MKPQDQLAKQDQAAFEAWTEKFWMFIEDKGDALHIWKAAMAHTAARCAAIADQADLEDPGSAGAAIRKAFDVE